TRSCGQSPASGRWPISKGLWRTTLEPATHPHLCTSRLLLLAEFGDGVLQRWGFFIPAILRNMFPAVLSILVPAMTGPGLHAISSASSSRSLRDATRLPVHHACMHRRPPECAVSPRP